MAAADPKTPAAAAAPTPRGSGETGTAVAAAPAGQKDGPDAGLRALDHYKSALPPWRYRLRQSLLPLIRRETPYLAAIQRRVRTPALDSYFAMTANLGTHTFFTLLLPVQFWCGAPASGKALVYILSSGVFFTGMIKDLYSLPRPLSPPLRRITMSGSAALEYGFPSTHSANAVSVATYAVLALRSRPEAGPPGAAAWLGRPAGPAGLDALAYLYAASIVFGRIYCGMHGFLDVAAGSAVGAAAALAVFAWGPAADAYMHASPWATAPLAASLACIWLVWIHPEPADDCPCFDDSVAVAGVVIGVELGTWTHGRIGLDPWAGGVHEAGAASPAPVGSLPWPAVAARLLLGFAIIFGWREVAKSALLRGLPRVFRRASRLGLTRRRRFFVQADEYAAVPAPGETRIDSTFPEVGDLPRVVESIRHPQTRGRSVSVGPQSAADAYETLLSRREGRESREGREKSPAGGSGARGQGQGQAEAEAEADAKAEAEQEEKEEEEERREVFSHLTTPRVRYDVEVVTKLVVYAGIGALATAAIPILFEVVGLGTNKYREAVV